MGGERLKIILSLAPPLFIITALFFGGILYGFLQSLGYQPAIGKYDINFSAYYNVMFSERYARLFWTGLGLNLWVSFASTFLAAVFALFAALVAMKNKTIYTAFSVDILHEGHINLLKNYQRRIF